MAFLSLLGLQPHYALPCSSNHQAQPHHWGMVPTNSCLAFSFLWFVHLIRTSFLRVCSLSTVCTFQHSLLIRVLLRNGSSHALPLLRRQESEDTFSLRRKWQGKVYANSTQTPVFPQYFQSALDWIYRCETPGQWSLYWLHLSNDSISPIATAPAFRMVSNKWLVPINFYGRINGYFELSMLFLKIYSCKLFKCFLME